MACMLSVGVVLLFLAIRRNVFENILRFASVEITQLVDGRQCDIGFTSLDVIDSHSSQLLTPGYFVDTPIVFGKPFPKRIKRDHLNFSLQFQYKQFNTIMMVLSSTIKMERLAP